MAATASTGGCAVLEPPEVWQQAITDFSRWMVAAGNTAGTIRIKSHYLRRLAVVCPVEPWSVTIDGLVLFLAVTHWKPATRHSATSAIRSFYRWAQLTGRVASNPATSLPAVPLPGGVPRPAPEVVLERALDRAPGHRERLMLMLAAYAGLRRGEIARLHSRDITADSIRVHGKGGKIRAVPLHPALAVELVGARAGFLFPGQIDGHLSADRVGHIVADLLGDGWTAHTLRHRFATRAYAVERDLLAVRTLLGHSKPETTMRYTAMPSDALSRAVLGAGPARAA